MTAGGQDCGGAVFPSGDRVGRDLAALDWAATPLGPPEGWPQSLIGAVRIMLDTRFPMWLAWGPQLTFFCNDAYRRSTLAAKYPWALGRPSAEVWSEAWDEAGPRIESVLRTGVATWDESLLLILDRNGYPEETYHTFSYSPLKDDSGETAGMLCVVSEDTERVVGERRVRLLTALGVELAAAEGEDAAYAAAGRALRGDPRTLPFALVYAFDTAADTASGGGAGARLVAAAGVEPGHAAAPPRLDPSGDGASWPLAAVAAGEESTVALADLGGLPTGGWPEPPSHAHLVPLRRANDPPFGFLVAGLNRYRPFDESYRSFLAVLGAQLADAAATGRAHDEERSRADAVLELDRAKTAFFTNVSHELRTPLTLLLGPTAALLADGGALTGRQRERLGVIQRNAERLLKLVNALLDFSRLEASRTEPNWERLDLAHYTAELAAMFETAVDQSGLELVVDCPPLPVDPLADREMWAKIVLNLLSNAVKFTFAGSITVRLRGDRDRVVLEVSDTGTGIAPEDQQRLFERFHRVVGARSRSHEGTGIGLALVAELADLHGGDVAVRSAPGEGTTFAITIPVRADAVPDAVGTAPDRGSATAAAEGDVPDLGELARSQARGFVAEAVSWAPATVPPEVPDPADETVGAGTVLIVDDNADMRSYVTGVLAERYRVLTAPDGEAGLQLVRHQRPDLVLTDVMMPKLDGFGLLARLRADSATHDLPVIMLSARSGEAAAVEGLEAGANDYLVKPFTARELLARVNANLELDRVRRLAAELEESRTLLLQAQRLAQVASWELDLETGLITGSPELARLLGLPPVAPLNLTDVLDQLALPDDRARITAAVRNTVETGAPLRVEWRTPSTGRPDAEPRHFRSVGELEPATASQPARLRGSVQDITQQREAEQELVAAAAVREAAAREHRIADELQRSLLPPETFIPPGLELATYYRAGVEGTRVGGDWYDVIPLEDGRAGLVVGDVMGSGVQAATIMGQLRTTLRAYARLGLAPAEVLELLDTTLRDLRPRNIATCLYGIYNPSDRSLVYASAGHPPPILITPGTGTTLLAGPTGAVLGSGPLTVGTERVQLRPGETIAIYTDGLVEHRHQDLDTGIAALQGELADCATTDALGAVPDQLVRTLLPRGPDDDVTVLLARVAEDTGTTPLRLASVLEGEDGVRRARVLATEATQRWGIAPAIGDDIALVVSELVTNALRHGRPPVELELSRGESTVDVAVTDRSSSPPRPRAMTPHREHGRGLHIVAAIAESWGTTVRPHGKTVWCSIGLRDERAGA